MLPLIWKWTLLDWSAEEAPVASRLCCFAQLLGGLLAENTGA